ncbi:MAG: hypothetical protein ABIT10_01945 [Alteraurantiacibacter sp.]
MTGRIFAAAAATGMVLSSQAATARDLAFIACPIVQDTVSVPCWLAQYEGETYYMGVQSDVSAPFTPPWLGHMALVEGTPDANGTRICGGIVLEPVKVSVMLEMAPECDTLLMADPDYVLPFEPRRPPGPSGGQLAFTYPAPPPPPQPPFAARSFEIYFPFDGGVNFQTPNALQAVLGYANAVSATRLEVRGARAAVRLTDGTVVEERQGLAELRARSVGRMFEGLVPSVQDVAVTYSDEPQTGDWQQRRVTITVTP